jgi:hypothetical protein
MARKTPAEFDPDWYLAAYPDVALSGLRPVEHYLRFGRMLGRSPNGNLARRSRLNDRADRSVDRNPRHDAGSAVEDSPAETELPSSPLIDRPSDFDPARVLPTPGPARIGSVNGEPVTLGALAQGPFASNASRSAATAPLMAYARLFDLELPREEDECEDAVAIGSTVFMAGETRIESAWFADSVTLRLMFAGGADAALHAPEQVFRAYQAEPAKADFLSTVGPPVLLPTVGPVFHDLQLIHPLMPVLLELADGEGRTRAFALIPFPSLLTGGMHWAELKAGQTEANPMDDFWAQSDLLLREAVGAPEWPERSISSIAMVGESTEREAALSEPMREWLGAMFGFHVQASASGPVAVRDDPGRSPIAAPNGAAHVSARDRLTAGVASPGLELTLPPDCIPTIGALVSRRLALGAIDRIVGPHLVADACSFRPRWSVLLPAVEGPWTNVPVLSSSSPEEANRVENGEPVHLAIAIRETNAPSTWSRGVEGSSDSVEAQGRPNELRPLSILLAVHDVARAEALVRSIEEAGAPRTAEFLVRVGHDDPDTRGELDRLAGERGWTRVAADADLRDIAAGARHDILLTLSDRIRLTDSSMLDALCSLLEGADAAASASCALIGERIIKKQTVLQPASAGLFPSRVSFSASPRLSFAEPDVSQALPQLTYPVVANTFHLTAFRRDALANLPRPRGPVPAMAADIRLGLDLVEAGYRNWCTTRMSAQLCGPYVRRDAIDPIGGAYAQPGRWEELLGKVTLVRALS